MKAIGYVRVSTEGQARDGVSMDAQEAKLRAWADLNGTENVTIFQDAGLSGKRADNRPGLQEALNAVGKGDVLIVYSLSRLARSTKDTITIAEALAKRGADLVSLSEKIDTTTAAGKMVFRMLAVLSEFERDQVSERTRFALAHKRASGEKTGGDVPYGYRLKDGLLVQDAGEQKAIGLIRKLHKAGNSLRKIARYLKDRGYRTKTGLLQWHPQSLKQILERAAA
ncbi:MAG: recombinase family protein [Kiritimatiellae bacterium]|nr:recombinase family protein [Kiritimatiellia bacterium]MDD5520733.1 recombinase family protein [Kiritimatiellia bacterium]